MSERWTVYVCEGCGNIAGEEDLDPSFGNIVTHLKPSEKCADPPYKVEVVPASHADRMEKALRELRGEIEGARTWNEAEENAKQKQLAIIGAALSEGTKE